MDIQEKKVYGRNNPNKTETTRKIKSNVSIDTLEKEN
jgi:hypothetical protein